MHESSGIIEKPVPSNALVDDFDGQLGELAYSYYSLANDAVFVTHLYNSKPYITNIQRFDNTLIFHKAIDSSAREYVKVISCADSEGNF